MSSASIRAAAGRARRPRPAPTCATTCRSRSWMRPWERAPRSIWKNMTLCTVLPGIGLRAGNLPADLQPLPRTGPGDAIQRLFQHQYDLPPVPGAREGHHDPLHGMFRRGKGPGRENSSAQDSGRRGDGIASPAAGRRGGGRIRRSERRSVCLHRGGTPRCLRKKRRRHLLPRSHHLRPGGPGGERRGADPDGHRKAQDPPGNPDRQGSSA